MSDFLNSHSTADSDEPFTPLDVPMAVYKPLSVTELTLKIKRLLETQIADVFVEGEISGLRRAGSGHLYFDLKDSGALIKCIMWSRDAMRLKVPPTDGNKVEIRGRLSLFDQRGQYQINVTAMMPAGIGKLYQAFLEMKDRLCDEGLFEQHRKKPLPSHPRTVALVTSPTGAAIRDMLNILERRAPHLVIKVWPVRVQGDGSASEIARAINQINTLGGVDVIIAGRGGGSLEDLWAFNEEIVARAICESDIPVISAVGHETDTTIADFVADLRAPTPSAAAELVARDSGDLLRGLVQAEGRIRRALRDRMGFLLQAAHLHSRLENSLPPRIGALRSRLSNALRSHGMRRPEMVINEKRQFVDSLTDELTNGLSQMLTSHQQRLRRSEGQLRVLNPKSILQRGYSITFRAADGTVVRKKSDAVTGTQLKIVISSGEIDAVAGLDSVVRKPKARKMLSREYDWFGSEPSEAPSSDLV